MLNFLRFLLLVVVSGLSASWVLLADSAVNFTVIGSESIVVNRFGVYPASITRKQGQFMLFVLNRLPDYNETFQVVLKGAEPDQNTPTFGTAPGQAVGSLVVNLSPGAYELRSKNHPRLVVELTITN